MVGLNKLLRFGSLLVSSAAVAWIVLFLATEIRPDLLHWAAPLLMIRYFATKSEYIADDALVFAYRAHDRRIQARGFGDLFKPEYKAYAEPIDYVATYDTRGFRTNSSTPPFDIAVIGDSFIEIGERDDATFPELLKRATGLAVENLGRGFYGPYQYLEVLKRYAIAEHPKYALVSFFAGNDFDDIGQYRRWKAEGKYYFYEDLSKLTTAQRFAAATKETMLMVVGAVGSLSRTTWKPSQLSFAHVGDRLVPMVLEHWEVEVPGQDVAALKSVLEDIQDVCRGAGITPILMYIPSASQVYGRYVKDSLYYERIRQHPQRRPNPSLDAVAEIAGELQLDLVNLLPIFQTEAASGHLLYYPFDTHWARGGREVAASFVASYLHEEYGAGCGTCAHTR
jgi:hypothetical protein